MKFTKKISLLASLLLLINASNAFSQPREYVNKMSINSECSILNKMMSLMLKDVQPTASKNSDAYSQGHIDAAQIYQKAAKLSLDQMGELSRQQYKTLEPLFATEKGQKEVMKKLDACDEFLASDKTSNELVKIRLKQAGVSK
jgi:hypothetical protein